MLNATSGTTLYSSLCGGKYRQQQEECEKCASPLTFMKVKPLVCIITVADVYLHAAAGAGGKHVQVR